jgi:transcriptional regulator with XRE-family HTH domain
MLGTRLRQLRSRKGRSQGQIAEYAKVPQSTLSDLERGEIAPKTLGALINLAEFYGCSTDYLLGRTDDPRPANKQALSEPAVEAINLIDSLPPEKRPSAVELLRAIIVFAEVGVPLPEEERELVGTSENASTKSALTWEVGAEKRKVRQLGLPDMKEPTQADLDRQLARLKRMVPADVYDYIIHLTEAGRPLSDADIEFLIKASDHKSLLEEFKSFQNSGSIGNG